MESPSQGKSYRTYGPIEKIQAFDLSSYELLLWYTNIPPGKKQRVVGQPGNPFLEWMTLDFTLRATLLLW
jgi:hypothetical protein